MKKTTEIIFTADDFKNAEDESIPFIPLESETAHISHTNQLVAATKERERLARKADQAKIVEMDKADSKDWDNPPQTRQPGFLVQALIVLAFFVTFVVGFIALGGMGK